MTAESESAAQRRLWFLQLLLEKMDAEKALELAARMEMFVAAGGQATFHKDDHRHPSAQKAPRQLPAAQGGAIAQNLDTSSPGQASHPEHEHISSAAEPSPPGALKRQGMGRLLNEGEQQAFINRAVQGATNRDLARLFGLTPRQANSIRMALAKRMPQVALRAPALMREPGFLPG